MEVLAKFKNPLKRFEIYEELEKLRFDVRHKLVAIIQLPGLKVVFYTHKTEQAIELREKLALSAKIEVSRFGENETKVTIFRVPPQFKDEEIVEELKIYGEVFKINALKDRYGIQIGKRPVFFKKNTMKEIPRFLTMGGVQILAYHNEQPPFVIIVRIKVTNEIIVRNCNTPEQCGKNIEIKKMWKDKAGIRSLTQTRNRGKKEVLNHMKKHTKTK